jgi:membrane protease YdiL (CAAX protease family)
MNAVPETTVSKPAPTLPIVDAGAPRPWGILASLAWYVLIFEIHARLHEWLVAAAGLLPLIERIRLASAANVTVAWGVQLALIVLAVRLTNLAVRDYLGWRRPPILPVVLGVLAFAAIYGLIGALLLAGDGAAVAALQYRAAIAAGTSPVWFVLQWWPAIVLAPFVEESFFRGFLWRGVQFRFGTLAAFSATTLLFAAMHYGYWARDGVVDPGSVIQYLVFSSIFGWLRWQSGGSTAPMIVHGFANAAPQIMIVVLAAIVP